MLSAVFLSSSSKKRIKINLKNLFATAYGKRKLSRKGPPKLRLDLAVIFEI